MVLHPQPPMEHTGDEAPKHLFQLHIVAPAAYKDGKCYLRQKFQQNNDVTILKHNCHVFFFFHREIVFIYSKFGKVLRKDF